ncbi:hypothetical protein [Winkia neuii]|uniref:hypothetical protein n=1 Tax=Winkia neuii TaxID=33007 RepID=UPI0023A93C9E|nr:hypothetical protein [Winkia neuii]WEB57355.1 hypothetical protein PUW65_02545 [Winkia neuii]
MSFENNNYGFAVGKHWVQVIGKNKSSKPTWTILVDEEVKDTKEGSGELQLTTKLDGQVLSSTIEPAQMGAVAAEVKLGDKVVKSFDGYLL